MEDTKHRRISSEILELKGDNILLEMATGSGKSKAALELALKFHSKEILIVVAETVHKDNWIREINKWGFNFRDLKFVTYHSLHKYEGKKIDTIIYDEAHHGGNTEKRRDTVSLIKANHVILLSATIKQEQLSTYITTYGNFAKYVVSLQEAINDTLLPEPTIIVLPLTLNNHRVDQIYTLSRGSKAKRQIIKCFYKDRWTYLNNKSKYPNIELQILCTEQEKYDLIDQRVSYYKRLCMYNNNEVLRNQWMQWANKRKHYLGDIKTPFITNLVNKLNKEGTRYICFCSSVLQAEVINRRNTVSASRHDNYKVLYDFDTHKINSIFAVGMLKEGQNLKDIESGIIVQLDGNTKDFVQKFGRTLRSKKPVQYILYYEHTRDEEYLDKALENINKNYVTILR